MSPEFAGDSMGSADVSICPFTVLAKGRIPWGDEVNVGTQPPLEMPSALQKTRKPWRTTLKSPRFCCGASPTTWSWKKGTGPLWDVGLWRDYIEGVNCGFGCREKWGVDKRHLDLDLVHPNHLE